MEKKYKSFTIPQMNGKIAILHIPKPFTKEDLDIIDKWFEIFREALIDEEETKITDESKLG